MYYMTASKRFQAHPVGHTDVGDESSDGYATFSPVSTLNQARPREASDCETLLPSGPLVLMHHILVLTLVWGSLSSSDGCS